jgi:hypothetical protein
MLHLANIFAVLYTMTPISQFSFWPDGGRYQRTAHGDKFDVNGKAVAFYTCEYENPKVSYTADGTVNVQIRRTYKRNVRVHMSGEGSITIHGICDAGIISHG